MIIQRNVLELTYTSAVNLTYIRYEKKNPFQEIVVYWIQRAVPTWFKKEKREKKKKQEQIRVYVCDNSGGRVC